MYQEDNFYQVETCEECSEPHPFTDHDRPMSTTVTDATEIVWVQGEMFLKTSPFIQGDWVHDNGKSIHDTGDPFKECWCE